MSQFSSNEAVSLEKRIELIPNINKTNSELINFAYEVDRCAKWILENDYKKVCLQFPDDLLPDSTKVVRSLEDIVARKVYVLGDTAYESCCVDYTAAKHISCDAIIHFGPTCFSKTENVIPCLKIYEKFDLNIQDFCEKVETMLRNSPDFLILINTPYLHKINEIKRGLSEFKIYSVEDNIDLTDVPVLYLGGNDKKLMNINLTYNPKEIFYFDPKISNDILTYEQDTKILKRRYFLIEKIKDSSTIGIVISTLAVRNYLKIIDRITTLAKIHGKKYYIISVGKPTVAKLANFPEVDVFVVVGCAMNDIYENREFYKPIVTPYDIESALNPKLENPQFSYDFNRLLSADNEIDESTINELRHSDVSLLTGQIRYQEAKTEESKEENTPPTDQRQVSVRSDGQMQVSENYGAGFLSNRHWKGLEQDLGKTEPQMATKGRKGIAQTYENETE